jgi:hypothetical protein
MSLSVGFHFEVASCESTKFVLVVTVLAEKTKNLFLAFFHPTFFKSFWSNNSHSYKVQALSRESPITGLDRSTSRNF